MFDSNASMIMLFVTIIIVVLTTAVLVLRWFIHQERMALIKHGHGRRLEPDGAGSSASKTTLAWGVGIVLLGLALVLGLITIGIGPWLLFGLIPLGAGIALIAAHMITSGTKRQEAEPAAEDTGAFDSKVSPAKSTPEEVEDSIPPTESEDIEQDESKKDEPFGRS